MKLRQCASRYLFSGSESNAVILAAKRAFDDPRLTGEPSIVEDSYAQNQENNGGSFNMGRAIVQPVLTFSSAQRGLYLFTARIMSSTWGTSDHCARSRARSNEFERQLATAIAGDEDREQSASARCKRQLGT